MRRDQAAGDDSLGQSALPTIPDRTSEISSKEGTAKQDWVPRTYATFCKVFSPTKFNLEHEKRFKGLLRRAASEDVALAAIERMWLEGVRYPTGYDLRKAIDIEHGQIPAEQEAAPGPFVTFDEWYAAQNAEMQERVRRVFPSLEVGL